MKRKLLFIYLFLVCSLYVISTQATTHVITVGAGGALSFSPANLSVALGDTIMWMWSSGSHTTTSDNGGIPAGATAWDQVMDATHTSFIYVPTVKGTYNYHCTPHQSMGMVASFTVSTTNVNNVANENSVTIGPNPASDIIKIHTVINKSPALLIYNFKGATVSSYSAFQQSPTDIYLDVNNLPAGVYFVKLDYGEFVVTKKITIAR